MQVKSFRFSLFELGGALGDLGTLLPLLIALVLVNNVSSTGAFLVVGLAYIITGLYYRIPMPVQPLKAVAAIAIATGLSASVIAASGLLMAGILLFLAATGIIGLAAKLFPKAVIRGIQLGVALILIRVGFELTSGPQVFIGEEPAAAKFASIPIGWLLAIGSGILLIYFLRSRRFPASLAVLAFSIGVGALIGPLEWAGQLKLGLTFPNLSLPALSDFSTALLLLVIPQLPLTLGNAVFATADTTKTYFGPQAKRVTHRSLLTTMGAANLTAGLLGGIPVCHGSGGVTAHFKLGARTGGANLMIGFIFVALALFLDGNAVPLFALIPYSALGVLVAFVGVQHALLARDLRGWLNISVAILIALVAVTTSNVALGFALGILVLQGQRLAGLFKRMVVAYSLRNY